MSKESILKSLEPIFKEAEEKGLWFYCPYQELWLSPEELREEQDNGRLIWNLSHWRLRDPKEKLSQLESVRDRAIKEYNDFRLRIAGF